MLDILYSILSFLVIISIIIIAHECGHYIAARAFGIKVTDFSIGWGPRLFSLEDKSGTTWKFCAIPLGGYIKYLGDADATSLRSDSVLEKEKKYSFGSQSALKKTVVAVAGPLANFLTAIIMFAYLFCHEGRMVSDNTIAGVESNTAAYKTDLKKGDKIKSIDGEAVIDFVVAERYIKNNPNKPLRFDIERDGKVVEKIIVPDAVEVLHGKDRIVLGRLGVISNAAIKKYTLFPAIAASVQETIRVSVFTLKTFGQILTGARSHKEMGSVIRISKYAGEVAKQGMSAVIYFIAILSINVGLFNLFPVPPLDGGHILLYGINGIVSKKAAGYIENYALRIGVVVLVLVMLFALVNDIAYLRSAA